MTSSRGHYVTKRYAGIATGQTAAERRGGQYHAFIPDPVAELDVALPGRLVAELDQAAASIQELNSSPPKLASLEGVARHLLRQEATASSRVEGLALGHRRIALADFAPERSTDQKAADIVGNIRAMAQAVELGASGAPVTVTGLQEIHRTLLRFTVDAPIAGKLRGEAGWIGGSAPTTAAYVPPPPEEVVRLTEDLCRFVNREDMPALVQAAVAHAQFENIHPFDDGNGRVGRCLIHTIFRRRGLAPNFVPPISVVFAARRDAYVAGLIEYREGMVVDWLSFFADVAAVAAREAENIARRIDELEASWLERFPRPPRRGSTGRRLIAVLPAHPVVDVKSVQAQLGVSDVAAGAALNELAAANIIRPVSSRTRDRVWECPDMYAVMAEFEESLR